MDPASKTIVELVDAVRGLRAALKSVHSDLGDEIQLEFKGQVKEWHDPEGWRDPFTQKMHSLWRGIEARCTEVLDRFDPEVDREG